MLLFIDMSRATYQLTRASERTDFNQTDDKQNYIILENIWIQTIKKTVFTKEDAHRYKNAMLQKSFTRGFLVPLQGPFFKCLQMKQHDLNFPTRESGKKIILFFFSFVLDCIVVVKWHLSRESWTKNGVNLYVCILCPS